jgi:hypothetical protein
MVTGDSRSAGTQSAALDAPGADEAGRPAWPYEGLLALPLRLLVNSAQSIGGVRGCASAHVGKPVHGVPCL